MWKNIFLYLLASICAICPVCIYTRKNPESRLSKKIVALEKGCPFCWAYAKIRAQGHKSTRDKNIKNKI